MKTLKTLILLMAVMVSVFSFNSCDDDGYSLDNYSYGIVTVKLLDSNSFYMQLDDNTTLWPVNLSTPNVKEETRALVSFTLLSDSISGYSHAVKLLQMEPILTKKINENLGSENDSIYGTDPVTLNTNSVWAKGGIWIEDNYLTIDFITKYGGGEKHYLNLIPATGSDDPYELEFRHNAFNDKNGIESQSIVSFNLDKLPSTNGQTVKLKIKYYKNENEMEEIVLDYKTKE